MPHLACWVLPHCPVLQYIYFIGFLLTAVASWLLRDYGGSALDFSPLNKVPHKCGGEGRWLVALFAWWRAAIILA
jgi:hypothetical protein